LITETVSPAANGWAKTTGQSIEDVRRIEMARLAGVNYFFRRQF
jgi:hypothetical protein